MHGVKLNSQEIEQYQQDGFILQKELFDSEEMDLLLETSKTDQVLRQNSKDYIDASGKASKLALWNHPGDDLYGMFSRCERIVNSCELLIQGGVYHFHSKVMMKEPFVGGAWEWHQDYGYWYGLGCLYPDLISAYISIDTASRENGCLQVIKGSHKMGRIDHGQAGQQAGADQARVEEALKKLPLIYCEMEPGDTLFFHSNLLHRSDQNRSAKPRWSLICCYNAVFNSPFREDSGHPHFTPLKKVADTAIKAVGRTNFSGQTHFWNSENETKGKVTA